MFYTLPKIYLNFWLTFHLLSATLFNLDFTIFGKKLILFFPEIKRNRRISYEKYSDTGGRNQEIEAGNTVDFLFLFVNAYFVSIVCFPAMSAIGLGILDNI